MIDEQRIQLECEARARNHPLRVRADWWTPGGRQRSAPVFVVEIGNDHLGKYKEVKGATQDEVLRKAEDQLLKWAQQEARSRIAEAKQDAKADAAAMTDNVRAEAEALRQILAATIDVDDRIEWEELMDRREMAPLDPLPPFRYPLEEPLQPRRGLWHWLYPPAWKKRLAAWQDELKDWAVHKAEEEANYEERNRKRQEKWERGKRSFEAERVKHNTKVAAFREAFESGAPEAIEEYVKQVFERSTYPESFFREYEVAFDQAAETLVVDVSLPAQSDLPNVTEYRFDTRTKSVVPVDMRPKDHDALYDEAIKQCVLRTVHEVFESVYVPHVKQVVVNGWVTYLNKATGNDETSCIISLSTGREQFEALNLARIDATECIKALKGLVAGPLSQVAPVRPILQLDTTDRRFVESRDVLADYNSTTNLAEIPWEDFEHLVRELFSKLFSADGAEVKVTQASRDGGVDAIAFDPDPIRGGKFVIQAKRYTIVVPVSAVRDLYGTMQHEGASKGILVTTSNYGRDARAFAQDKPITLIDGSNLVHLLEENGYHVRIDVDAAKKARRVS